MRSPLSLGFSSFILWQFVTLTDWDQALEAEYMIKLMKWVKKNMACCKWLSSKTQVSTCWWSKTPRNNYVAKSVQLIWWICWNRDILQRSDLLGTDSQIRIYVHPEWSPQELTSSSSKKWDWASYRKSLMLRSFVHSRAIRGFLEIQPWSAT